MASNSRNADNRPPPENVKDSLCRYDRPSGPERPIFGLIRYMSSENIARKFSVKNYIRKYEPDAQPGLPP